MLELLPTLKSLGPRHPVVRPRDRLQQRGSRAGANARRARLPDLDALPNPDREAIDHQYLDAWRTHHGASSVNLITARGCPTGADGARTPCTAIRTAGAAGQVAEVAWIVDRYDPDQLWYADDVFTISHPWLYSYRKELEARGLHLPFETITRADRLQSEEAVGR